MTEKMHWYLPICLMIPYCFFIKSKNHSYWGYSPIGGTKFAVKENIMNFPLLPLKKRSIPLSRKYKQSLPPWLHYYNHKRPHCGKHCFGKTPCRAWSLGTFSRWKNAGFTIWKYLSFNKGKFTRNRCWSKLACPI